MNLPYVLDEQYKRQELQANFDALATASDSSSPFIRRGAGTPEGNVAAPVGTLYLQTDGGAGTTLWVKETGTGDTGWDSK